MKISQASSTKLHNIAPNVLFVDHLIPEGIPRVWCQFWVNDHKGGWCTWPYNTYREGYLLQGVPQLLCKVIPTFSRTYVDAAGCPFTWWSGIEADLVFWKNFLTFFILSGSGPGTSSDWFSGSVQFAASSSSCYPQVFNFLTWKPLHLVNLI